MLDVSLKPRLAKERIRILFYIFQMWSKICAKDIIQNAYDDT